MRLESVTITKFCEEFVVKLSSSIIEAILSLSKIKFMLSMPVSDTKNFKIGISRISVIHRHIETCEIWNLHLETTLESLDEMTS